MQALESDLFLGKDGVRTLFRIEECTRAVDIQPFSSFKSEAEVLLIPGAYLEVVDVGDMGHGLVIITLKQIEPPFEMLDFEWEVGSTTAVASGGGSSGTDESVVLQVSCVCRMPNTHVSFQRAKGSVFVFCARLCCCVQLQGMGFSAEQIDKGCKHGKTAAQVVEWITKQSANMENMNPIFGQ
jgi:hypothetical protein